MLRSHCSPAGSLFSIGCSLKSSLKHQARFVRSRSVRSYSFPTHVPKAPVYAKLGGRKAPDSTAAAPLAGPWLIVGLGNPGKKYTGTRHNVGFAVLDRLASQEGITLEKSKTKALTGTGFLAGQKIILAQPQNFMNLSGQSVGQLCAFHKIPGERMLVVCDDLDLPLGKVRLRAQGGHGGHNGLRSILQHRQGSQAFGRIRIGIGRPADNEEVADYVLQRFTKGQEADIEHALDETVRTIQAVLQLGMDKALSGVR
ncbi:hypothetical protein WJX74_001118 [Apatococcus lobatus]|uniref:peptidyl-tRNA hydrolase n=1 Tax=Apatococcus lobatus TaxID=904363 RepID=A0AAW1QUK6_9CHLO